MQYHLSSDMIIQGLARIPSVNGMLNKRLFHYLLVTRGLKR